MDLVSPVQSVFQFKQEVKTANEARAALSPFKNHSLTMLQSTSQMAAAAELLDHVIPLAWVDQQVQAGSPSYLLLDCLQKKNLFAKFCKYNAQFSSFLTLALFA